MTLIEKLELQQNTIGLVLFKEGVFLRAYNESAYMLTQLLGHNLKITYQPVKLPNQKWVVNCAFPYSKLNERLPNAVKTVFGAQLAGDFNTQGYPAWYLRYCREADEVSETAKASSKTLKTNAQLALSPTTQSVDYLTSVNLVLNRSQLTYLIHWQKDRYSPQIEKNFIESLQQNLTKTLKQNINSINNDDRSIHPNFRLNK